MSSIVELQYNPYLPQVNMLIDGKPPASYSRLIQYSGEDIWDWASNILDMLYAEIRDSYCLLFTGTDQDADILRHVCEKDDHCRGFQKRDFIVNGSLQSRMGQLNQLIKKTGTTVYEKTVINAVFFIPTGYQAMVETIKSIDIHNLFCTVKIQILGIKSDYEENDRSVLFIIAENYKKGSEYLANFNHRRPNFMS